MEPERIAVFGGGFDPIHRGHLTLAAAALERPDVDHLLWVPTCRSPEEKTFTADFTHRASMLQSAVAEYPNQSISLLEKNLKGTSYTLNTLRALKTEYRDTLKWWLLIGSDQLAAFTTWYHWQDLIREADLLVYQRPGFSQSPPEAWGQKLEGPPLEISSSQVREELARKGHSTLIPESVLDYIRRHGLYQT